MWLVLRLVLAVECGWAGFRMVLDIQGETRVNSLIGLVE